MGRAKAKLAKVKERHEVTLAKLNKIIESQLADMQGLKSLNQSLE